MFKKLTILFAPMEGVGNVNPCIGMAEALQKRDHKIVFLVNPSYKGKLSSYGFIEELLFKPIDKKDDNENPGRNLAELLKESGMLEAKTPLENMRIMAGSNFFETFIKDMITSEPQVKQVVNKYKPDVCVIDHVVDHGYCFLVQIRYT